MLIIQVSILLLLLLLGGKPSYSAIVTIPIFSDEMGHIFTKGKINGKNAILLIDTGCSASLIIKDTLLEHFGVAKTDIKVMPNLKEGSIVSGLTCTVEAKEKMFELKSSGIFVSADLTTLKKDSGYEAVIGLPLFDGYSIIIDYSEKVIKLYNEGDSPEISGMAYLTSSRICDGIIEVSMRVGNGDKDLGVQKFLLDTGANNILLSDSVLTHLQKKASRSVESFDAVSRYKSDLHTIKRLTFGSFYLSDWEMGESRSSKNKLGMTFIEKFRIYVSCDRQVTAFFTPIAK